MKVWLPSSFPSRTTRRTRSGWRAASLPTTKNVAETCSRRRIAAIFGVQRGSGPSSKVSAIRRPGGGWVETRREPRAPRIGRLWTSGACPPAASCGVPLAPIVWVAIPSKRIATVATTKQKESKRQCAGTRNRARAFTLRLLRRRECRLRLPGRCRAPAVRHTGGRARLRLSGRCRAPPMRTDHRRRRLLTSATNRRREHLGRHRRTEIRGRRLPGPRQLRERWRPLRRPQNVHERNPGNRHQTKTAQHDRQQPAQKQHKHETTSPSQPPSTPTCRILEDRGSAADRRPGHTHADRSFPDARTTSRPDIPETGYPDTFGKSAIWLNQVAQPLLPSSPEMMSH